MAEKCCTFKSILCAPATSPFGDCFTRQFLPLSLILPSFSPSYLIRIVKGPSPALEVLTVSRPNATMEPEHRAGEAVSEHSSTEVVEKQHEESTSNKKEHLEVIRTVSRVPNPHYYEKDGLRTYGDDEDHDHEPPVPTTCRPI